MFALYEHWDDAFDVVTKSKHSPAMILLNRLLYLYCRHRSVRFLLSILIIKVSKMLNTKGGITIYLLNNNINSNTHKNINKYYLLKSNISETV